MDWIKIDKDNLPTKEVLAANFAKGTYGYKFKNLGLLYYDEENNFVGCDGHELLEHCTHYIDLDDYDIED